MLHSSTNRTAPKPMPVPAAKTLRLAFERMKGNLFSERFVPWKFHPRDKTDFEPNSKDKRNYIKVLKIKQIEAITNRESTVPVVSDEAYSLSIEDNGSALIKVIFAQGGLQALDTFAQLFYAHSDFSVDVYTPYAAVVVSDSPAFQHRGINLDISRNQIFPKDVMRTLDAMSFNKFNRLHLHATDSQSWPLEIPALPDLAIKGAYHTSQIWTTKDLQQVQEYGAYRGIEVYLEIDMPGHTASIAHAYPDLITAFNQRLWSTYALEPPAGQLKLNSSEVPPFLTSLLNDLLPRTSKYSSLSTSVAMNLIWRRTLSTQR